MAALGLKPGEVIADIGAGSGYFTFRLAHHVGDKGKVYAVDVSPDMIRHINRRIREIEGDQCRLNSRRSRRPTASGRSVNRFFFSDSWHHIENQTKYLSLMKKMLKPSGEIVMIDFHKKELPVGPPMQMKIAREDLIKQMETQRISVNERTHLPAVPVFPGLCPKVDQTRDSLFRANSLKGTCINPFGSTKIPPNGD